MHARQLFYLKLTRYQENFKMYCIQRPDLLVSVLNSIDETIQFPNFHKSFYGCYNMMICFMQPKLGVLECSKLLVSFVTGEEQQHFTV